MSANRRLRRLWLALICFHASGCAQRLPPLQVPADLLAVADRFEVSGRVGLLRHTVSFGPYVAKNTRVGVQHPMLEKPTLFNGQTERAENHQAGSFELITPEGAVLAAECQKHQRSVSKHDDTVELDADGNPRPEGRVVAASETFRCTLARTNGTPMQLFIVQGSSGLVQAEDVEFTFLPVNSGANQPASSWKTSAGFLVADGVRELAAVDLTAAPAITMRRGLPLPKQDELATVCMALLLLRDMF